MVEKETTDKGNESSETNVGEKVYQLNLND